MTSNPQQVCIDLPGEEVRCVVHKPHLQVLLRKHRDVIFELFAEGHTTYSIESTGSDFYCVRDEKLIKTGRKVSFKDGERLHLWVGRGFRGELLLKEKSAVLGRYEPNRLDPAHYGEDASAKPGPLMITMRRDRKYPNFINVPPRAGSPHGGAPVMNLSRTMPLIGYAAPKIWTAADVPLALNSPSIRDDEKFPTTVIIDGNHEGIPDQVMGHFAAGGGSSGLVNLDPNDIATRNWLYGQLAGTAAYAKDNWSWLRHSVNKQADGRFRLVSARAVRLSNGRIRIYYQGYARSNPAFGAGGFTPSSAKVIQTHAGVGSTNAFARAAVQSAKGAVKGNALVSLVFGSAATYAEWRSDATKDGFDLTAALLMTVLKTVLVALATIVVVAIIAALWMIFMGAALAALAVAGITVVAGIALSYLLDSADKAAGRAWKGKDNDDGLADGVADMLREAGDWMGEQVSYLERMMNPNYRYAGAGI